MGVRAPSTRAKLRVRLRHVAVLGLDMLAAVAALYLALVLRVGFNPPAGMIQGCLMAMPVVAVIAAAAHILMGMQPRLWRFASIRDLILIIEMATVVAVGSAAALYLLGLAGWMPRSLPAIHWLALVLSLASLRVARRLASEYFRGNILPPKFSGVPQLTRPTAIYAGNCDGIDLLLRANERNPLSALRPIGILADNDTMPGMKVRSVPVVGVLADLETYVNRCNAEGTSVDRLIFAEPAERLRDAPYLQVVAKAEGLGLKISCLSSLEGKPANDRGEGALRPIDLSQLLDRPQKVLDFDLVHRSIKGRRVLVTGAGGTIGRELVRQIAAFEPEELVLLEASEFALYDVDLEIKEKFPNLKRVAAMCCIRQRKQLMKVFEKHRPELVFHAAALKHVPLVELHPSAGVQTNVLGTRNVADAACRYGAKSLVQVSTDKAVNPIGMMGATKRLGELYCQALDIAGSGREHSARFLTVRFGNVLGSSGSLIPLFQRQLDAGVPLTVTHPDITRYFMTVQEAVQLVLQASARTLNVERGRIFVLDMGEPVKVLDIARRMIRLAGKVPDHEVKIKIVGLRPGEKLYEELFNETERRLPSVLPGIFEADPDPLPMARLNEMFNRLQDVCDRGDDEAAKALVFELLNESLAGNAEPPKIEAPQRREPRVALVKPRPAQAPAAATAASSNRASQAL